MNNNMDIDTKRINWLFYAEQLDAWRIAPRAIVLAFFVTFFYVLFWYTGLANPSMQQSGFIATITGVLGLIIKFYVEGGRNWRAGITTWKVMALPHEEEATEEPSHAGEIVGLPGNSQYGSEVSVDNK